MDADYLRIPEQLVELATKLSYSSSSVDSMQIIVDFARDITNADSSVIFLFDKSSASFQLGARNPAQAVSVGLPRKNGLTSHIFNKDDGIFFTNDASREKVAEKAMGYHQSHSFIGIRLQSKENKFGVLYVRKKKTNQFSSFHVDILRLLAAQIGLVFGGFSSYLSSSSLISQAVRRIYTSEDVFKDFCSGIMERWKFDYAAIQLIRRDKNAIETVHVSDTHSNSNSLSISGLSRHSLSDKSIHDIQAEIALSNPPLIMIVSGWYEKFDEWIYDENKHDDYIRIWLPLPIVRNSNREIVNSDCEWHTHIHRDTEECFDTKTQRSGRITEITKEYYLNNQNQDISTEIIGTIDCGYKIKNSDITADDAEDLFRYITNNCVSIYQITLQHVLESIATQAYTVVNAASASLHYPFDSNVFSEPYVVSAGKGVGDFLTRCKPRANGMGFLAIEEENPVFWNNLKERNPNVYSEGIRSMAAFPLNASNLSGVLYLHYTDERSSLSSNESQTIEDFVSKAEDAIDQAFHYMDLLDNKRVLNFLHNIDSALLVDPTSDNLLSRISGITQNLLAADIVNIYEYDATSDRFEKPAIAGQLYTEWEQRTGVGPNSPARLLLSHGSDLYEKNHRKPKHKSVFNSRDKIAGSETFVNREKIVSTYGSLLKVADECVGVMFINFRRLFTLTEESREIIRMLASSAAIAIKTKQSFRRLDMVLERQNKEKRALHAVDLTIKRHPNDLDAVLNLVLENTLAITDASSGSIVWHNHLSGKLEIRNSIGLPINAENHSQEFGEGIVGICAQTLSSILVPDVMSQPHASNYLKLVADTRSELAVPLKDDKGLIAVLNLEHTKPYAFSNDDKLLIESFANQAVIAIHSTELFRDLEQSYQSIETLRIIVTRFQAFDMSLLTMIRSLLTGVTANSGLGYSRAMFFLIDHELGELEGYTAIGANSKIEADQIWNDVINDYQQEYGQNEIEWLLDKAQTFCETLQSDGEDYPLSKAVKSLRFQLGTLEGAIAKCVDSKTTIRVRSQEEDATRSLFSQMNVDLEDCAFACVPIVGEENKPLGVIVVDRRYLFSEKDAHFDIKSLEAYAGVAALSIENSKLREKSISENKLKDLKFSTFKAGHVIKSRIGSLDDAIYKLQKAIERANKPQQTTCSTLKEKHQTVYESVEEMKAILRKYTIFSKDAACIKGIFRLKELLERIENKLEKEIRNANCEFELTMDDDFTVYGDSEKLKDLFIELIENALESIATTNSGLASANTHKGHICIKAFNANKYNSEVTCIEVSDNGHGVPKQSKHSVFNPYITTNSDSAGLGLAIVKDIATSHGGDIEETGIEGKGALFKITIPRRKSTEP